jgi:hypothetical protein
MEKKDFNEADWILKLLAYNLRKVWKRIDRDICDFNVDEEKIEEIYKKCCQDKKFDLRKELQKEDIPYSELRLILAKRHIDLVSTAINILRKQKHSRSEYRIVIDEVFSFLDILENQFELSVIIGHMIDSHIIGLKLQAVGGHNRLAEEKIEQDREEIQGFVNDLMQRRNDLSFTRALEHAAKEFDISLSTIKRRGIKRPA